ncbi:MAG: hypothetical protein NTX43_07190 [Bacteroidetes bacterium]|nr:hypothetical protein [Bacteroidota bacterium]
MKIRYIIAAGILCILPSRFMAQDNNNTKSPDNGLKLVSAADPGDRNNNFYDNADTYALPGGEITVEGEVENPGKVDLTALLKHSIIVKEAVLGEDGKNRFTGAYRYDGYSLFDILSSRILKKKNKQEFSPVIDLYVIIENAKGDKVVLSWGEIFYPNNLHKCIIATEVTRIVPSKTKDLWPLPSERKLVMGNDLLGERNISNPVKITVRTPSRSIPVNRDLTPLYSPGISITEGSKELRKIDSITPSAQSETYNTVFYGRGRGIHSTTPFTGIRLKDLLDGYIKVNHENLQKTLLTFIAIDGYRTVFSLSEVMNRCDQEEVLLIPYAGREDGGRFRLFPACDFFSDRAIKAISEISVTPAE